MAAKFILVLFAALFSVAFAMPAGQPAQMELKENMTPAETSHFFSLGLDLGHAFSRYSPYEHGHGLRIGLGLDHSHYDTYDRYMDDYPYGYHK